MPKNPRVADDVTVRIGRSRPGGVNPIDVSASPVPSLSAVAMNSQREGGSDVDHSEDDKHGAIWRLLHENQVPGILTAKEREAENVKMARNVIKADQIDMIKVNGRWQPASTSSDSDILSWWKEYIAAYRSNLDRGMNPNAAMMALTAQELPSITARFRNLTGKAKEAEWVSPKQGEEGPGLRDHFAKHGEEVGANSARQYDLSARETIQNGRRFTYRDRKSNEPRVGYWDPKTGYFTATSETRKVPAIMSHYPAELEELRRLPGFTWD